MVNGSIDKARDQFEKDLNTKEYSVITSDEEQLNRIIRACRFESNSSYVDIGTGRGYVAFAIAKLFSQSTMTGIDIIESVIDKNNEEAIKQNKMNLVFKCFDGIKLPFETESINGAIARYSFHHFPNAEISVKEISRILKNDGFFFISDPVPERNDSINFADKFSQIRNDGHIKYYHEMELKKIFEEQGIIQESCFHSSVEIPREMNSQYQKLLDKTPDEIKKSYKAIIENGKLKITVTVANILFRKNKSHLTTGVADARMNFSTTGSRGERS